MERPGDDFKATHNVTVAPRDTLFGGQISRLQVAEVVSAAIARTELAENKVGSCRYWNPQTPQHLDRHRVHQARSEPRWGGMTACVYVWHAFWLLH